MRPFEDKELARRAGSIGKRGKAPLTKLKENMGIDRAAELTAQIERNIEEFINSPDEKIRLEASKAFTDYYKPRKKESNVNIKGTIQFIVNKDLAGNDNQESEPDSVE